MGGRGVGGVRRLERCSLEAPVRTGSTDEIRAAGAQAQAMLGVFQAPHTLACVLSHVHLLTHIHTQALAHTPTPLSSPPFWRWDEACGGPVAVCLGPGGQGLGAWPRTARARVVSASAFCLWTHVVCAHASPVKQGRSCEA